ncbi:MAG: DUF4328 domain-containing protein [Hyphomonadaceae bacterium]
MVRDRRRRRGASSQSVIEVSAEGAAQTGVSEPTSVKPFGEVRSVHGFATWLKFSLYVFCLLSALTVFSDILAISFFRDVQSGVLESGSRDAIAGGERIDQIAILANFGFIVSFLSSGLAYGFFFQRSLKNLQAVHEADQDMKPFGVWAWYFVPIAALWKPLEGFSEVRYGSRKAEGKTEDAPKWVGVWWASWIAYSILNSVSDRVLASGLLSGDLGTLTIAAYINIAAMISACVAAIILARFVIEIARGQEQVQFMSSATAFE